MVAPGQKLGPMDRYVQDHTRDPPPAYENSLPLKTGQPGPLVQKSESISNLWETAVANTKKKLPTEIELSDSSSDVLQTVCDEAKARQNESERKQWKVKVPGKSGGGVKLRDAYGAIASCATRFRDVGDIAAPASPMAAPPWVVIRVCLTAAINEHETFCVMIEGLEMVSGLVTHYVVIERIFVEEDSDHARAVKNSLLALYTAIMEFLIEALNYFPPVHVEDDHHSWLRHKTASAAAKIKRAFRSLDSLALASVKDLLNKISGFKNSVDADANHAYANMNIQVLDEFGHTQSRILKQLERYGLAEEERDRRLSIILEEFQSPLYSMDDKVSEMYEHMEETQRLAQLSRFIDWLSPTGQESSRKTYHKSLRDPSRRLKGSGQWLLNAKEYLDWQNSKFSSVGWLSGTSGTGKTVLLSVVIDHLQERISKNGDPDRLAFFYASAREASSWTDPDEVIRNIVCQLSVTQTGTTLEPAAKQKYDQFTSGSNEPPRPTMSECVDITVALTSDSPTIIIIDALDELKPGSATARLQSSRNDLIEGLSQIVKRSVNPVKLLFSVLSDSPAEARLRKAFANPAADDQNCPNHLHVIDVDARNSEDIDAFIKNELSKKIDNGDLLDGDVDIELKTTITSRLIKRSNGMFRYASMQIDRLCDDRMDKIMVLEELEKPLPGITSLYDNSINEIRHETIDRIRITAQQTLKWLLCIQEPLPIRAFLEAVSVDGGINEPKESSLHSACRQLVKTDHYANVFAFTHPSVREHLAKQPEYSESDCHLAAADRCLRMIIVATSSVSRLSDSQARLYQYAKLYWPLHYQRIDFNPRAEDKTLNEDCQKAFIHIKNNLRKFLMQGYSTSLSFKKWLAQIPEFVQELGEHNQLSKQLYSLQASMETPLHVICVFGFAELINTHYKHFDFNQRNANGQTALCLAVENNQQETVKALLANDLVDVNEFNVKAVHQFQQQNFSPVACYASALQAAAVQGSQTMLETLIECGAGVHLVAGYYGSALQAACYRGHKEIVEFLLENCHVDPNSQGGYYGNALQAAAANAKTEIVDILLKNNACETATGGHYGTALMAATCAGDKEIIDCLLTNTAEAKTLANVRSQTYGTPLQRAIDMDRIDIVDLLVANGADLNAAEGSVSQSAQNSSASPLAIAAWNGHNKIVSILCRLGADADLSYTENAFHLFHQAAMQDMIELVQYCLDERCDPNMVTDKGPKYHNAQRKKTPLSFACAEGHLNVVQKLLQNGALILLPEESVTNLHLAAYNGHCDVIVVLIKEHKDQHSSNTQSTLDFINMRIEGTGNSALVEASRAGAPNAVSLLLENGATLCSNNDGIGPLHVAAWEGRPKVAEILISFMEQYPSLESDINARNKWGKTALIDAAERNRIRIFELLLHHGADCKIQDNDKNSLLHYVAWRNHHEIAKLLLNLWDKESPDTKAALLAAKNKWGNTGLQEALFRRHFQIVQMLVAAGAKVSHSESGNYFIRVTRQTNKDDISQAIKAFEGYPEELSKFLNHRNGADGYSLLHDAAEHDRMDIIQLVLQYGADVTTMDAEQSLDLGRVNPRTVLHVAVWNGHISIVDLLLNYASEKCDKEKLARFVNRPNNGGKTVLMAAAETNRPDIMKSLLSEPYNADWSLTDNRGHNVLHYCASRGHKVCVELLLRYACGTGDNGEPGQVSRSREEERKFAALLNQQSTPNGLTPLHDVTAQGHQEIAMLLLKVYHAEYEVYDVHGDSILHRAVQSNHDELLRPYLEYMAMDHDQEKFRRVLTHRNKSMNRTVWQAADARGRTQWADLVKKYGG